jgi:hypothetical protein
MTWPIMTSGNEQTNVSSTTPYETLVGSQHVYIIIGEVEAITRRVYIQHFVFKIPQQNLQIKSTTLNLSKCDYKKITPAGLAVPCVFLIVFGVYISHFQGRCDGALRIFCPCLPTIWENRRPPPRREMDAIVVLSTMLERKKKILHPDEFACVVVMPDKSCQVAWQEKPKGRKEEATLRPPPQMSPQVVYLQATVAGSPLPNSLLSTPNQQQKLAPLFSKDGLEVLSQDR